MSALTKYATHLDNLAEIRAKTIGPLTPKKQREESACPVGRLLDSWDHEGLIAVIKAEEQVGKIFSSLLEKMERCGALKMDWKCPAPSGQPRLITQSTKELKDTSIGKLYQLYLSLPRGSFGESEHQSQARRLAEATVSKLAKPLIETMMTECNKFFATSVHRDADAKIAEAIIKSRLGLSASLRGDEDGCIVPLPSQCWKSDHPLPPLALERLVSELEGAEFTQRLNAPPTIRQLPIVALLQRVRELESCHLLKALDVGCGSSPLTYTLGTLGFTTTAVDIDPRCEALVERDKRCLAQHLVGFRPASITFEKKSIQTFIKKSQGPFDCIFCSQILHFLSLEEQYELLQQMVRILAPGGLLYVYVHTLDKPQTQQGVTEFSWKAFGGLSLLVSVEFLQEALRRQEHQIQAQAIHSVTGGPPGCHATTIMVLKKR